MLMLLLLLGCPRNKTENNKCQGPGRSDLPGMLLNWNLMSLELFTNTSDPEGRKSVGGETVGLAARKWRSERTGQRKTDRISAEKRSLDKAKWRQL